MALKIVRRLIPGWGTTYGPPGEGPFPAIMILHGSEGAFSGWSHRNAAILAAHGFLAFPFGYSNGGNAWNAGNIVDVPLDRTVEAMAALRAFTYSSGKIGLYGISRGAEHALLLASLMARDSVDGLPQAIAVHSPPDVICGASDSRNWRDVGDPGWQSWDGGKRARSWRGSCTPAGSNRPYSTTIPITLRSVASSRFLWRCDARRPLACGRRRQRRFPMALKNGKELQPRGAVSLRRLPHQLARISFPEGDYRKGLVLQRC